MAPKEWNLEEIQYLFISEAADECTDSHKCVFRVTFADIMP